MNTPTPPAEFMKQAEREAERQFNCLAAPAFVEGAKWAAAALAAPPVPTGWHVHFPGCDGSADWVQLGAERPDLAQWPEAVAIPLYAGAAPRVPAEPAYMFQIGETYETQSGQRVTVYGRTATYMTCSDGMCRYDRKGEPADAGRVTGTDHDYSCPDNFKRADRPTPPKEQA